uniref:Uncharacterized protein n=1 Tax=Laticauda laticaudata TaxID=8630 RepID=A0A8C5RGR0_LATLA
MFLLLFISSFLFPDFLLEGKSFRVCEGFSSSPFPPFETFPSDALETAARAEGLPLESSADSHLRALDEEHPKGKYHYGLNLMKPIRTTSKHRHPIDNAGLFSYMTFSWLSPLARLAYKKGELLTQDVWPLSTQESSEVNCRRYGRLAMLPINLSPKDHFIKAQRLVCGNSHN